MIIPFKQYLIHESRMLGIKPHALYMRIVRGKHYLHIIQRDRRNRITLVVSNKPEHSRWVKHAELVQMAKDAVRAVYADQSVNSDQTEDSLQEIRELVETLISQIPI